MDVFLFIASGVYLFSKWLIWKADEARKESESKSHSEAFDKYSSTGFLYSVKLEEKLQKCSKDELITLCFREEIVDIITVLFGNDWVDQVDGWLYHDIGYVMHISPLNIIYLLIMSKHGFVFHTSRDDILPTCLDCNKMIIMYRYIEKCFQEIYPEDDLFFWWYPGKEFDLNGNVKYLEDFKYGRFYLNKLAPRPDRTYKPPRKKLEELIYIDIS